MAPRSSTASHAPAQLASPDRRLRVALRGGPLAAERARAWLGERVPWLGENERGQLLLLCTELVNNAVRHGGASEGELIGIAVWPTDVGVGVEVSDAGPGFTPAKRREPLDEPGGWGLVLVDRLAERWGVRRDGRTRVWFELAAEAG
jgi:anti-sigma regulatory factor (Ser/Thr protein kinase)